MREQVGDVYVGSYDTDFVAAGGVFRARESFMERFDAYSANPDLDLVVASVDGEPIGQAWGWPLPENARWWTNVIEIPEPDFTVETGRRTFALSEIMVRREHAGGGVAKLLHDTLLSARTERRATLLVDPKNVHAYAIYLHWGWQPSGALLKPTWEGSPTFQVLTRELEPSPPRDQAEAVDEVGGIRSHGP